MGVYRIVFALVLICQIAQGQNSIDGTIENWKYGSSLILGDNKKVVGQVKGDGSFTMQLENQLGVSQLSNWFSCPGTDLSESNVEQPVGMLTVSGAFILKASENNRFSIATMVPSSSPEFAKFVAYRGRANAVAGFSVNFYYVEQPAVISGVCERDRKSGGKQIKTSRNYQLHFKKGWNMVLFEIKEVFTNSAGVALPKVINYRTIYEIPENLKYQIIISTQKYN